MATLLIKTKVPHPRKLTYLNIPSLSKLGYISRVMRRIKRISSKRTQLSLFPPELTDKIWSEYHHYFLDHVIKHSIVGVYLVKGGIKYQRCHKITELAKEFHPTTTFEELLEPHGPISIFPGTRQYSVCLHGNRANFDKLGMGVDMLRQIVQAGDYLNSPRFRTIDLESPFCEDMTPFSVSGHDVTLHITSEAMELPFQLRNEAKVSIIYILEETCPQNLVISWDSEALDIYQLPALPKPLKALTIRQSKPFPYGIPTHPVEPRDFTLKWKLCHLKVIRFESCILKKQDFENLRGWLPNTRLIMVK